jgi:fimbrial chaperone protein
LIDAHAIVRAAIRSPAFLLACSLLFISQAMASDIQINPTRIHLDADQRVQALTLTNTSTRDISFQVELVNWLQRDGDDHYEPTGDLLATPPIFTVPARQQQIVRVGLRRPPGTTEELAYRIFIQELPAAVSDDFTGLRMVLRMGLPIFVAPATGQSTHQLVWRAELNDSGQLQLRLNNQGTGHAQISELTLRHGDQAFQPGGMFYVLPSSTRIRALPLNTALPRGSELELTARVNREAVSFNLRVE